MTPCVQTTLVPRTELRRMGGAFLALSNEIESLKNLLS